MTFVSITDYLIEHPAFIQAMESYNRGDSRPLKNIIIDLQINSYQKTAQNASRAYGLHKRMNSCDIKSIIRELPPPDNLEYYLPIPKKPIKKNLKQKMKVMLNGVFPNQLNLFSAEKIPSCI